MPQYEHDTQTEYDRESASDRQVDGAGAKAAAVIVGGIVAAAVAAGAFFWSPKAVPADDLPQGKAAEINAAFDAAITKGPYLVPVLSKEEARVEIEKLPLPTQADLVKQMQAQTPNAPVDVAKVPDVKKELQRQVETGQIRMGWVMLNDFVAMDGDVVTVSVGGLSQSIPIFHSPRRVAFPLPASGVAEVLVRADHDGGGGVTVGITSPSGRLERAMAVGEVVTIPVSGN